MTDQELRQPFESAIDAALTRGELATAERLVYADWLDERGDAEWAELQRWLAENGKTPLRPGRYQYDINDNNWHWFPVIVVGGSSFWSARGPDYAAATLHRNIWDTLEAGFGQTRQEAEAAVATALARLANPSGQ